jgi:carboxymethylenebutenolidase
MTNATGKRVTVSASEGATFDAYLSTPSKLPAPGLVVLQEIFGLNAFVRDVCDEFAQAGYLAIAPDLFWRQERNVQLDSDSSGGRERGMILMRGLDERLAVEDAAATMEHLQRLPQCTGKVGAVGYCLGGKLAYLMAARTAISAAVSYYGVGIQGVLNEAAHIRVPLLVHIAADDQLCPPPAQQEINRVLGAVPSVTIQTHRGVGHAFARNGSAAYEPAAAQNANAATLIFLSKYLYSTAVCPFPFHI